MQKTISYILFLSIFHIHAAFDYVSLINQTKKYKDERCLYSFVTFVRDTNENKYVVKQYKSRTWSKWLATTITELVAMEMGHALALPFDDVCLIPAGVQFPGKDAGAPATLHTHAPGIRFDKYEDEKYKNLSIRQQTDKGLTREIIYHMSRHKDLPAIVALDTFVGNIDRGRYNYFYNQSTDSFTGIDLGASFNKNLCKVAAQNIRSLAANEAIELSDIEWHGLSLYYETLQKLVELYPPGSLCAKLDEYAHAAGLFDSTYFNESQQKKFTRYFLHFKRTIRASYPHAKELLKALEELFEAKKCN